MNKPLDGGSMQCRGNMLSPYQYKHTIKEVHDTSPKK